MPRTRLSAALYLFLVFASGIIVGIAAHRLYVTTTASADATPKSMSEFKVRYLAEMQKRVGINEQQKQEVSRILDDTKRKFDELNASQKPLKDKIHQDHLDEIRALLTDQQRVAFDKWHNERMQAAAGAAKKTNP